MVSIISKGGYGVKKYFDGIFGRNMLFVVAVFADPHDVVEKPRNVGVGASAVFAGVFVVFHACIIPRLG